MSDSLPQVSKINSRWILISADTALLALAITTIWLMPDERQISAALTTAWVLVGLYAQTRSRIWASAVGAIILLNLREIVLGEGPRPVSHMDYVLLIAAFLSGQGKSLNDWRLQATSLCLAVAAGAAWNFDNILAHIFANHIDGFKLGFLLVNHTALLAGLASLAGVTAFQLSKRPSIRLLIGLATLLCIFMVLATRSRSGLGLIPISLFMGWTFRHGGLKRPWRSFMLKRWLAGVLAGLAITFAGLFILRATPQLPELTKHVKQLYDEENLISDKGRIDLWRCYMSLPFSGDNSFLFGVGYGKARQLCQIYLPRRKLPLTHAHNFPLQIWAESGTLPLAALFFALLILGLRLLSQQSFTDNITGMTALVLYALSFNLLELGMLKVPLLTALFGRFLSTALARPQNQCVGQDSNGPQQVETP